MNVINVNGQKWIDKKITKNKRVYHRFNSSIIHLEKDKYIIVYRCFVPDINYINRRIMKSAHVWKNGWDFALEKPILSLVSINKNKDGKMKINTLKELEIVGGDFLNTILEFCRIEDCRVW